MTEQQYMIEEGVEEDVYYANEFILQKAFGATSTIYKKLMQLKQNHENMA